MTKDPVSDLLTRIRNAGMRHESTLTVPASRYAASIVEALVRTNYLEGFKPVEESGRNYLSIQLKYTNGVNAIQAIKQLSRQGLRRYSSYKTLRSPRRGGGILLLSTPVGILSDKEARKRGVGGELLCEIHS